MKNILLADDNNRFIEAFRFLLDNIGDAGIGSVYTAANGLECIDIVKTHKVDLVFMDADMPGMDGAQATRQVMEHNRFIKVVALSFHNEADYIRRMINAGAVNYIKKENINVGTILKELR